MTKEATEKFSENLQERIISRAVNSSVNWSLAKGGVLTGITWLVALIIHTVLLFQLGFDFTFSISDALISQTLLAMGILGITFMMRYYRPDRKNLWRLFDWTLVLTAAILFSQQFFLKQLNAEEANVDFIHRTLIIRGVLDWLLLIVATMASWLVSFWSEQQETEKRKQQAERLARESELANLRQQLHPHFLFNSLNSISALVGTRPEEARRMVQQLSDFLRGSMRKDELQSSSFEEELQYLRLYLDIEKVRFGHRLNVDFQIEQTTGNLQLPALLLQPVVENAIKFGLYDTIGTIDIRIKAQHEQGMLVVEVSNPFDPETAVPQKGTGFGLSSVRRRLFLLFSRNDLLSVAQQEKVFTTTIRIPQP